jgi:hypothetical protein
MENTCLGYCKYCKKNGLECECEDEEVEDVSDEFKNDVLDALENIRTTLDRILTKYSR